MSIHIYLAIAHARSVKKPLKFRQVLEGCIDTMIGLANYANNWVPTEQRTEIGNAIYETHTAIEQMIDYSENKQQERYENGINNIANHLMKVAKSVKNNAIAFGYAGRKLEKYSKSLTGSRKSEIVRSVPTKYWTLDARLDELASKLEVLMKSESRDNKSTY